MAFVFLLGGARSGKSALAVRMATNAGSPVTFIATALAGDEEMTERIRRHRESRPAAWKTVDAPLDLVGAIGAAPQDDFLVIDCLTLWVSNLAGGGANASEIDTAADRVVRELVDRRCVVVSNEVGLGIVPVNEMARKFRDTLGSVNARFAAAAERAVLMIAGRALELGPADIVLGPR
jgi:adenosyl cobinamide kinase/adenosyl cobinamide phosphate guanylyltransferase